MKYPPLVKVANTWPGKTHINFKHSGIQFPWKFHCPQPLCFFCVVAATEKKLDKRIEHHVENTCPWFGGGTTTFSWGVMSDKYLQPIWAKLDAEVNIIKRTVEFDPSVTDDDIRQLMQDARLRARGLAEALALLMPPFFSTGDEIVREAIVRWEKRQAGEKYETPGLGMYKFQRPPGLKGDPDFPSWVTKPEYDTRDPKPKAKARPVEADQPTPVATTSNNLTDEEKDKIKKSVGFPISMLARAYNVTPAVIKAIQAS